MDCRRGDFLANTEERNRNVETKGNVETNRNVETNSLKYNRNITV